jgi:hypothetical protein
MSGQGGNPANAGWGEVSNLPIFSTFNIYYVIPIFVCFLFYKILILIGFPPSPRRYIGARGNDNKK